MLSPRRLLFCGFILLFGGSCSTAPEIESPVDRPAHHTESGFRNLYITDVKKSFFTFLRMRLFGDDEWIDPEPYAGKIPWQPLALDRVRKPGEHPQISWLGHSMFLVQYQGVNILTDPVMCERTSPFSFMGPKRYTKHVVDYAQLPEIDYVIISHNHYDHLDTEATKVLHNQTKSPRYYVPLGIKAWLLEDEPRIKAENIVEMDWGEHGKHQKIRVSAFPSQHWSARGLFDRFETLWASWRFELADLSVWFAGDTGYNERLFRELGKAIGPVDLSLIPIGAYEPRHFMKDYHLNPEEAVRVHQHLQTRRSIGMHWGTYPLTAEAPTEPPQRLEKAAREAGLAEGEFSVMTLGETRLIEDFR